MVEVQSLTKRFGAFTAISGVSFSVRAGESFALLGPNGSGKTTTLKCIAGLTIPDDGRSTVGGLDVRLHPRTAAALFSYLPQRVAFPDHLTAREALEFYARLRRVPLSRAAEALAQADLDSNGAGGKMVGEFSGGMVQRLGIAVASLPGAPVLLLDEPAVSLDPRGATAFRDTVRGWKREGKTIVFSTHVLSDVELLADRVAVLVGGRLVAVESVDALRNRVRDRAQMRVLLAGPAAHLPPIAISAGAESALADGRALTVSCGPERRRPILLALEHAGAAIESFWTDEPSLEEIYLRYVNETGAGDGFAPVRDQLP